MDKKVIHTVIDSQCKRYPDKVAIAEMGQQISYMQLKVISDNLAHLLVQHNIKETSNIAVYLPSSIAYVTAILGINKAGGVFMPLDPEYPLQRAQLLLDTVLPKVIITNSQYKEKLITLLKTLKKSEKILCFISEGTAFKIEVWSSKNEIFIPVVGFEKLSKELPVVQGDQANYLIYTSGSTGQPKIIQGCHKGLSHFVHWEVQNFGFDENCKVSQLAPITFDVSLRDIFVPLLAGGTLCIPDKEDKIDPFRLLKWMHKSKLSIIHTVPSLFKLFIGIVQKEENKKLSEYISHIFLAGEPLMSADVKAWTAAVGNHIQLVNLYGPSETTLAKMFHLVNTDQTYPAIIPLGMPLPNTSIIIESNGQLCNSGAIGEILIKTPFRSKGYFNNSVLNNEKFVQNPLHSEFRDIVYKTGDFGKYLEDGSVAFMGRQDGQIKIRGNRVEIGEVESIINTHRDIKDLVITVHENTNQEKSLICYYTSSKVLTPKEFRAFLGEKLPEYMIPSYFLKIETLPLNFNGKVDRKSLPLPSELIYAHLSYEAPISGLEKDISKCWQEILNLKKIGRTNSFFELGGHSLSATKLVSRISEVTGKQLSLKDFFEHSTIESLAAFLRQASPSELQEISKISPQESYPLSLAQHTIWTLQQTVENRSLYNMNGVYELNRSVNASYLKAAVKAIMDKHEVLRTSFGSEKGTPRQYINESIDVPFFTKDFSGLTKEAYAYELDALLKEPFDLNTPPLLRVYLIDAGEESLQLLFIIHHIICDGWSGSVFMNDLAISYEGLVQAKSENLVALDIQYKDYVYWQKEIQNSTSYDGHKKYWEEKLREGFGPLSLPLDFPNAKQLSYEGEKLFFNFDKTTSSAIKAYIKIENISLFVFITTMINVLLYKFCHQKRVSVGIPCAIRNHPDLENQIGMYLNFLVLSNEINSEGTIRSFTKTVNQSVQDAMTHMEFAYEDLLKIINENPQKNSLESFYNVLVVMNNSELNGTNEDLDKLEKIIGLKPTFIDDGISKLPLTFFIDDKEEIALSLEFSTELFHQKTIENLAENLIRITQEHLGNSEMSIKQLLMHINDSKVFEEMPLEDF